MADRYDDFFLAGFLALLIGAILWLVASGGYQSDPLFNSLDW